MDSSRAPTWEEWWIWVRHQAEVVAGKMVRCASELLRDRRGDGLYSRPKPQVASLLFLQRAQICTHQPQNGLASTIELVILENNLSNEMGPKTKQKVKISRTGCRFSRQNGENEEIIQI
jgi:hypothetical protein